VKRDEAVVVGHQQDVALLRVLARSADDLLHESRGARVVERRRRTVPEQGAVIVAGRHEELVKLRLYRELRVTQVQHGFIPEPVQCELEEEVSLDIRGERRRVDGVVIISHYCGSWSVGEEAVLLRELECGRGGGAHSQNESSVL